MSPQRPAFVMAVSLVLCGPVLLGALRGDAPLGSAGARYGLALVLTWASLRGLGQLVAGYRDVAAQRAAEAKAAETNEAPVDRRQPGSAPAGAARTAP